MSMSPAPLLGSMRELEQRELWELASNRDGGLGAREVPGPRVFVRVA
jgi:hypothetical protein